MLKKEQTLRAGFEPARGDPIGFQVQRLNHSAIAADETNRRYVNYTIRYLSITATLQILQGIEDSD